MDDNQLKEPSSEQNCTDDTTGTFVPDAMFRKKYSESNPISQFLVKKFFRNLQEILDMTDGELLDVGAGRGDAYQFLDERIIERGVVAVEPDPAHLETMKENLPKIIDGINNKSIIVGIISKCELIVELTLGLICFGEYITKGIWKRSKVVFFS